MYQNPLAESLGFQDSMDRTEMDDRRQFPHQTRQRISSKVEELNREIRITLDQASEGIILRAFPNIQFQIQDSSSGALRETERSLALDFITRLWSVHPYRQIKIAPRSQNPSLLDCANIEQARACLHDLRPVIQNNDDPVHFNRIHGYLMKLFSNRDPTKGHCVTVYRKLETSEPGEDATEDWVFNLKQHHKFITRVLRRMEFHYVYNGILSHSDDDYRERMLDDRMSGEFQWTIIRHACIATVILEHMRTHSMSLNLGLGVGFVEKGL